MKEIIRTTLCGIGAATTLALLIGWAIHIYGYVERVRLRRWQRKQDEALRELGGDLSNYAVWLSPPNMHEFKRFLEFISYALKNSHQLSGECIRNEVNRIIKARKDENTK